MKKGRTPEYIGTYNKNLILEILMRTGPKSRAELARISNLTKTAISEIVDDLLKKKIIIEVGKVETERGRRPTKLTINPDLKVLSVDLSGMEGRSAVFNAHGEIEESISYKIDAKEDLLKLIDPLYRKYEERIVAISLSVPGIIDRENGKVILSVSLNWENFEMVSFLEKYYKKPIYIEKDTNVGLIAENWYGDADRYDTFFYLLLEKGIGLGIFYKGEILEGFQGIEGEIGHTTIKENGEKCWCGNSGCLEIYASLSKIVKEFGYENNLENILKEFLDKRENEVLERTFNYLGISLANAIHLLAPEAVCISGNMFINQNILDMITKILKEKIEKHIFNNLRGKIFFYSSKLGRDSLLIGAGILGFLGYFKEI
jgi:glucokinase